MEFDVAVIGAGPGGYVAAIRAAQLGKKVALIEKEATLGGTCLNVGCIPSKALLDSSELFWQAHKHFAQHGIQISPPTLVWETTQKRKASVVQNTVQGVAYLMRKNGITVFRGLGRMVSGQEIVVEGEASQRISAKNIIIATGSEPADLPHLRIDGKRILSSTEVLALPEVPSHLVVVGGGVIGIELGTVYARLGTQVTVVEYLDRILPPADAQIAQEVQKFLTAEYGIQFLLAHEAQEATYENDQVSLNVKDRSTGQIKKLTAPYVLVAVGRKPYTKGLEIEKAGLSLNAKGQIPVDAQRRTAIPHIYAIGDVVEGPMLAHKASEEGLYVAEIIAGHAGVYSVEWIPSVVYIWPEVAWVGASEEELQKQGISYRKGLFPYRASGRARAAGDTHGLVKVLSDAKTDRLLGLHIWGPRAADMIAVGVMALAFKASAEDLAILPYAHPTFSEAIKEATWAAALGSALHI